MSEVIPLIIGTAGHVDHGKTSLVRALTQFETDQHPEEKARGMSIDFAVAPFTLSDGRVCGLLDVPGHEDFIKNMVSGASSVDIILLVVAADDGIMPQTIEHLRIAYHLGASIVIPVITKVDLADSEQTHTLALEVLSLISSYNMQSEEPVFVSNTKNTGIQELHSLIEKTISGFSIPRESEHTAFRMFVRTCFNSKGHGSIVTGVPSHGSIQKGAQFEVYPPPAKGDSIGTLRYIQNYRSEKESTRSHISSALNIRKIENDAFIRGSTLFTPGMFSPTREILVWFKNTSSRPLVRKRLYQLHLGTFKTTVSAYPMESSSIEEGEEAYVQFRLQTPTTAVAGDRFIIREGDTIGGGIVLTSYGRLLKREFRSQQIAACKKAYKEYTSSKNIARTELRAHTRHFLTQQQLFQICLSCSKEHIASLLNEEDILPISSGTYFNLHFKELFLIRLEKILAHYHSKNPVSPGMPLSQLAKTLGISEITEPVLEKILSSAFKYSNGTIKLATFSVDLSKKEQGLLEKIEALLAKEPAIAKGTLLKDLSVEEKEIQKLLKILQSTKQIKVIRTHVFSIPFIEDIKSRLTSNAAFATGFTLSDFRDFFSISRNLAVVILEMFDSEGFTRRSGDERILNQSKK